MCICESLLSHIFEKPTILIEELGVSIEKIGHLIEKPSISIETIEIHSFSS